MFVVAIWSSLLNHSLSQMPYAKAMVMVNFMLFPRQDIGVKELRLRNIEEDFTYNWAFSHICFPCIPHSFYPEVFLYCLHLTFMNSCLYRSYTGREWQEEGRVNLYPYILLYILGSLCPTHLQVSSFAIQLNHTYIDKHGRAGTINFTFCNKHPLPLHCMLWCM